MGDTPILWPLLGTTTDSFQKFPASKPRGQLTGDPFLLLVQRLADPEDRTPRHVNVPRCFIAAYN
jgi:hypothetical protein